MKLVTKEIAKLLPPLYTNEDKPASEVKVPLKLFNPCGAGTWYISEMNPEEGLMFGWCLIHEAELGYVSLPELESLRLPFGLKIERDLHWNPETTLAEVMEGKKR